MDLQQTPKGQPRSSKASAGASKGRANGRSKATKLPILMDTGLPLGSAGSRSVNNFKSNVGRDGGMGRQRGRRPRPSPSASKSKCV